MTCPFGFLVVLPDQMILIPVDSHFSWLTMFYMLPKELVEKRSEYLMIRWRKSMRDQADLNGRPRSEYHRGLFSSFEGSLCGRNRARAIIK